MARRITQVPVEVVLLPTGVSVNRRITQEPVEVALQPTGVDVNRRITQEPVEVGLQPTGVDVNRRITQIVIEVAVTNEPFVPGGDFSQVIYPDWGPHMVVEPTDLAPYASYHQAHRHELWLGRAQHKITWKRR